MKKALCLLFTIMAVAACGNAGGSVGPTPEPTAEPTPAPIPEFNNGDIDASSVIIDFFETFDIKGSKITQISK